MLIFCWFSSGVPFIWMLSSIQKAAHVMGSIEVPSSAPQNRILWYQVFRETPVRRDEKDIPYTLWWTYRKLLKMAIEIVDFTINSMVFFHSKMSSPEGINIYYLGKFHHDRTLFSRSLESWLIREIIPIHGRTIQVSEILYFNIIYPDIWAYMALHAVFMRNPVWHMCFEEYREESLSVFFQEAIWLG